MVKKGILCDVYLQLCVFNWCFSSGITNDWLSLQGVPFTNMVALQWRHSDRDGVPNHQPHDCLLNRWFRHRWKKTSKFRVTGLCPGDSPATAEFPTQRTSNAENMSIWLRHHVFNYGMDNRLFNQTTLEVRVYTSTYILSVYDDVITCPCPNPGAGLSDRCHETGHSYLYPFFELSFVLVICGSCIFLSHDPQGCFAGDRAPLSKIHVFIMLDQIYYIYDIYIWYIYIYITYLWYIHIKDSVSILSVFVCFHQFSQVPMNVFILHIFSDVLNSTF